MINSDIDAAFEGKTALITGATGFVGRNLLSVLIETKSFRSGSLKLICVTRQPNILRAQWPNVEQKLYILNWDIHKSSNQDLSKVDFVFHLAGENRVFQTESQGKRISDTTILGTKNVLEASSRYGSPRIAFASSGAVYGSAAIGQCPFREDMLIELDGMGQQDPYRASKRTAELLCSDFNSRGSAEVMIARMFTFVGPYLPLNAGYAIGNFIHDCLSGRPIRVNSDGSSVRTYQYSLDLINWLITILIRGQSGRIYNVGSSEEISIAELSSRVAEICDNQLGVEIIGRVGQDPVSSWYVPNIERAKHELGLHNLFTLSDSILSTYRFYLNRNSNP